MITTKDVKTKDTKGEKLTSIQTGNVKPDEFIIKGREKQRDNRMITTSNVEKFQKELKREKEKLAKKQLMFVLLMFLILRKEN